MQRTEIPTVAGRTCAAFALRSGKLIVLVSTRVKDDGDEPEPGGRPLNIEVPRSEFQVHSKIMFGLYHQLVDVIGLVPGGRDQQDVLARL